MFRKRKKLDPKFKELPVSLHLNAYEAFLIMDALAGFPSDEAWFTLYQKISLLTFEAVPREYDDPS